MQCENCRQCCSIYVVLLNIIGCLNTTNTSARWTQWLERFNTHLVAAYIKDETQKRAILLYQAGPEVYEIFKALPNAGEAKDFKKAVDALTAYFEPDKNKIYQVYMFRQAKQMPSETVDQYRTRLCGFAKYCDFTTQILRSKCK